MKHVIIDTDQYFNAHGKLPRGRGGWAFQFRVNGHWTDFVFVYGTYTQARKEIVRRAKSIGVTLVRVGS